MEAAFEWTREHLTGGSSCWDCVEASMETRLLIRGSDYQAQAQTRGREWSVPLSLGRRAAKGWKFSVRRPVGQSAEIDCKPPAAPLLRIPITNPACLPSPACPAERRLCPPRGCL